MNNMKDKLTSSVRKAKTKTTQQSESENVVSVKQSTAESIKVNLEVKSAEVKQKKVSAGNTPENSSELFPDRVWPD